MNNDAYLTYDFYDYIDSRPILTRPQMWLGSKSIIAFGHFYQGLSEFGGRSHGGPRQFILKNELFSNGFNDWVHAKRGWPGPLIIWDQYVQDALRANPRLTGSEADSTGFDLFVQDLKEFRSIP